MSGELSQATNRPVISDLRWMLWCLDGLWSCDSLVAGGSYRFLRLGCVDDAVPLFANTHMGTGAHFADIGGMTGYVNSGPRQLELPYPTPTPPPQCVWISAQLRDEIKVKSIRRGWWIIAGIVKMILWLLSPARFNGLVTVVLKGAWS